MSYLILAIFPSYCRNFNIKFMNDFQVILDLTRLNMFLSKVILPKFHNSFHKTYQRIFATKGKNSYIFVFLSFLSIHRVWGR